MAKILLFAFSVQPLIFAGVFAAMMLNANRVAEALAYMSLIVAMSHYAIIGLEEIFSKK